MTPRTACGFGLGFVITMTCCEWHDMDDPFAFVPPTVDDDPNLPALEIRDTRLHLRHEGDPNDPLIVLLHGGPGDDYRYIEPLLGRIDGWSLSDDHEVVVFDQRSSGLSRRHDPEEITLAAYLADLEALVDYFSPDEPVILIGHSWGGQYAAMYMNAHPERVAGAVLMEPGGFSSNLNTDDTSFDFTAEWISDFAWGRSIVTMEDHARADYYLNIAAFADIQTDRNEDFSPWWRFGTHVKLALILNELAEDFDFTTRLGEVPVEVLFIVGSKTGDLGEAYQRQQMPLFDQSSIAVIKDAGHSDLAWSRADDSLRVIRTYLEEVAL